MTNSLNLSEVIECVKNIVDSVRCTICDKTEGDRARYSCGHTICDGCLTTAEGCVLCLTPPSTLFKPLIDEPFSRRARNACNLLSTCQDTFQLDVYRHLRISEQLKVEKELFPDCIQAPVKYSNKRKSLMSTSNKENLVIPFYPGENISQSDSFKMNKCNSYVQQWLNTSAKHPRKALADIKLHGHKDELENTESKFLPFKNKTKQTGIKNRSRNDTKNKIRKRSHSNKSYSLLEGSVKSNINFMKMRSDDFDIFKDDMNGKKDENDESGIVLDDEPILIEDSQSQHLDKDALALLAVEAADNKQRDCITDSFDNTKRSELRTNVCDDNDVNVVKNKNNNQSVSFFKKSTLSGCCTDCVKSETKNNSENVTITIENNSFVATISISNLEDGGPIQNSVHVQTEISEIPKLNVNGSVRHIISDIKDNIPKLSASALETECDIHKSKTKEEINKRALQSPNIFELNEESSNKRGCVVIDESDSDEGNLVDSLMHVTAEVHRSCEPLDYGILGEINASGSSKRLQKRARGATPDSNNSSDKENCDPNKYKKRKQSKKYMLKK